MELGATVCVPAHPRCELCPVANACRAKAEGREKRLPVMSAKKAPTPKRVQSLVATSGERILLARRTRERLFGGLWEPPSVDGPARLRKALLAHFTLGKITRIGAIVHVLSHRILTVDVLRAELTEPFRGDAIPDGYDAVQLASPGADIGISTLARKVLAAGGIPWHRNAP